MGIDVTDFGLPILLTSGNTIYLISFLGSFFPPSLSLSLNYDVNRIGRPKAVTSVPFFLGHKRQLPNCIYTESFLKLTVRIEDRRPSPPARPTPLPDTTVLNKPDLNTVEFNYL